MTYLQNISIINWPSHAVVTYIEKILYDLFHCNTKKNGLVFVAHYWNIPIIEIFPSNLRFINYVDHTTV